MNKIKRISNKLVPLVFLLVFLAIWEGVIELGGVEKYIMPAPTDIVKAIVKDFNALLPHITATLYESLVGFIIAIVLALVLAIIMDLVPFIKKGLYPLLVVSQTVPVIALAPLFYNMVWFWSIT